jgi:hypothetical protein
MNAAENDPTVAVGELGQALDGRPDHAIASSQESALRLVASRPTACAGMEPDSRRVAHVRRPRHGVVRANVRDVLELSDAVLEDPRLSSIRYRDHDTSRLLERAKVRREARPRAPHGKRRRRDGQRVRLGRLPWRKERDRTRRPDTRVEFGQLGLEHADAILERFSFIVRRVGQPRAEVLQRIIDLNVPTSLDCRVGRASIDIDGEDSLIAKGVCESRQLGE